MSEDLSDFFKLLSTEKKQKKNEFQSLVGDLNLENVFAEVSNYKKIENQKKIKEKKKIEEEKKKEDDELKNLVGEITLDNLFEEVKKAKKETKEREKIKKEKEKKALVEFENFLYDDKITETESVQQAVEEWIEEVVDENVIEESEEVSQENEKKQEEESQNIIENNKIKEEEIQKDPLMPLTQDFVTFKDLQEHYRLFINRIQQQLSSLGGGGETQLKYLDDVVGVSTNPQVYDGKYLKYNHSIRKFEFSTIVGESGDFSGKLEGLFDVDASTLRDGYMLIYDQSISKFVFVDPASLGINSDFNPNPIIDDYGTY